METRNVAGNFQLRRADSMGRIVGTSQPVCASNMYMIGQGLSQSICDPAHGGTATGSAMYLLQCSSCTDNSAGI